jgi:ATP-dependent Clp protease protease subunit
VTLRHDTDRDLILPAQAAVDYGLADRVLTAQVPVGATAVGVSA